MNFNLSIPFYSNTADDTHCWQASLKMVLKYFQKDKEYSWEELDLLTSKKEGLWTWPTAGMLWLANNGFDIKVIESFDYMRFSAEGKDYIYKEFQKEWDQAFQANGYVLLGWAEVGFIYFFTNAPVHNLTDLKGVKMWMWEGDPIAEGSFKTIGIHPVPLSITDVMTSLQTGLIDGVYSSPLAILALQWFTKTKYMYDYHLADAAGSVLISKKTFDQMPKD